MYFEDLKNLITFAKEMGIMKKSFTEVYKEWLDFWDEYFKDLEADYWIEENKLYNGFQRIEKSHHICRVLQYDENAIYRSV